MKTTRALGRQLLLRLLLVGSISGFLGGYIAERVLQRYGYTMPVEMSGPLFGVILGLVIGFFTHVIARRVLLNYIHSLHEELSELGEIRPGLRQDLDLDDEAAALYDLVDYEVSALADDREKLQRLVQRAQETLEDYDFSDVGTYGDYEQLLDDRINEMEGLARQSEELADWFESTASPIFSGQMDSFSFDGLEDFDRMVEFQSDIKKELENTSELVRDLKQVIQPWKKGPQRLKNAIGRANEVLTDASNLFKEFPHEELPEKAEALRQETEAWEELARQIEQGVQRLNKASDRAESSLRELHEVASESTPPERVWEDVKEGYKRADNKIERLREAMDQDWLDSLKTQVESVKSQATWLTRTTRDLKEELKEERNQVEELSDLLDTLEDIVGKTDTN